MMRTRGRVERDKTTERPASGRQDTNPPGVAHDAVPGERRRQRLIVLVMLTAIIAVDQAAKWWAWRHASDVDINPGGDVLTGPVIGRLYAQPFSGALLDLADFGWVTVAAAALAFRPRPTILTICGSLMVGGWASDLLDRLGMHYWTAPGSVRGAVDFISMTGTHWNLADFAIIGGTRASRRADQAAACRAKNLPASAHDPDGELRRRPCHSGGVSAAITTGTPG